MEAKQQKNSGYWQNKLKGQMTKVLAIAPYAYLPFASGGQKFIAKFLEHLGKETDLTVISVATNDFSISLNYKTIPLLKNSFTRYFDIYTLS